MEKPLLDKVDSFLKEEEDKEEEEEEEEEEDNEKMDTSESKSELVLSFLSIPGVNKEKDTSKNIKSKPITKISQQKHKKSSNSNNSKNTSGNVDSIFSQLLAASSGVSSPIKKSVPKKRKK